MKGVVLLSDGIDSPVAYYIMKKRMECIAVHLSMGYDDKIREIMKLLGGKIYFVPYDEIKEEILKVKESYRCIICKRFMYRIAERIANLEKAGVIITGENIGQVASQTLDNLKAIEQAVDMPVIRPLIAMDKEEIVNIAKKIGTYEISIMQQHRCPMAPKKPVTKARVERVKNEESEVDLNKVKEAVAKAKIEMVQENLNH
ncbi:MAG: hypothetical protein J7K47_06110 [Thermoplasmata archaeon]|nr:hypothetical protein [Thermoplasmata archaeon]